MIVLPIEQGAGIGIALSLLHGIWSTTRARLTVYERVPGMSIWWPSSPNIPGETEPDVIVAGFQAPLSFLNAYPFRSDMMALLLSARQKARLIVLEATGIVEIDFTAAQILSDIIAPAAPPASMSRSRAWSRSAPSTRSPGSASRRCSEPIICFTAWKRPSAPDAAKMKDDATGPVVSREARLILHHSKLHLDQGHGLQRPGVAFALLGAAKNALRDGLHAG